MGNGEKKKKKHPAEALHRKMALASECCAFSKDLTCVCVCVCSSASKCQVRFSSVCVFFSRCVAYRDPQLRCTLVTVFSPPDVSFANRSNNMWTRIREYLS